MRVLADSHAIVWHLQGSERISPAAATAIGEAETTEGVIVSVATLIDLWYVTQTTRKVTAAHLAELRERLASSAAFTLQPIDVAIADAAIAIPRESLTDPWDRFIVATAKTLNVPLITRDARIRESGLVATIW